MLFNCGIRELDPFGFIKKIVGEFSSARALFYSPSRIGPFWSQVRGAAAYFVINYFMIGFVNWFIEHNFYRRFEFIILVFGAAIVFGWPIGEKIILGFPVRVLCMGVFPNFVFKRHPAILSINFCTTATFF